MNPPARRAKSESRPKKPSTGRRVQFGLPSGSAAIVDHQDEDEDIYDTLPGAKGETGDGAEGKKKKKQRSLSFR